MKVAFRTDASLLIGSGHVMRCLTLADALKAQGAQCHFISRQHPGHMLEVIRQRGYKVNRLVAPIQRVQAAIKSIAISEQNQQENKPRNPQQEPAHTVWLGSSWQTDGQETATVLASLQPDWLVVDHYALDHRWEAVLQPHCRKLMVIDDLADRPHSCDLLLDQNLGRLPVHYAGLVPVYCQVLTGPHYALLRPEFAALRPYSLKRRQVQPALRQLLITMGGVDQRNATGQVLQALKACALPVDCRITVVMGLTAPWLQNVQELAAQMPWPTEVVVNVNDMAQRMADSDLAIGAAGSSSWERCCLGLPTLMITLAENQQPGAHALGAAKAARWIGAELDIASRLPVGILALTDTKTRMQMGIAAGEITDGCGADKVLQTIKQVYA
jgi:UDP-2,4-diacetamido-2,4,6-trideoxy-beta-L-altropyranose hydrolase